MCREADPYMRCNKTMMTSGRTQEDEIDRHINVVNITSLSFKVVRSSIITKSKPVADKQSKNQI